MGRKHTEETKAKMSRIAKEKGRKPPGCDRTGSSHTEETKAKMRKAHAERAISLDERQLKSEVAKRMWAGRRDEIRRKMRKPNTKEHNARISASWTPERRETQSVISRARMLAGEIGTCDTSIELFVEDVLVRLGVSYDKQFDLFGHVWDFALPHLKLFIEADGCYWHGCIRCGYEGRSPRDAEFTDKAHNEGWMVLRCPEHLINQMPRMVEARIRYTVLESAAEP